MKPISYIYLCLVLFTLPFMVACDNEDEDEPVATKTEMLAANTWQGEAVFASGVDVTDNDELSNSMPDVRTLTLKFETDGSYTAKYEEDGAPVEHVGSWELRNNEAVLYFDLMPDYELKISTLNDQRLVLTTDVTLQGNITVPAEVHFRAM